MEGGRGVRGKGERKQGKRQIRDLPQVQVQPKWSSFDSRPRVKIVLMLCFLKNKSDLLHY